MSFLPLIIWFTSMGCKWRRVKIELFQGKHIFFVQATGACLVKSEKKNIIKIQA